MKLKFLPLLLFAFHLNAQESSKKEFSFGIEIIGAQNYASFKSDFDYPFSIESNHLIGMNVIYSEPFASKQELNFGVGFRNLKYMDFDGSKFIGTSTFVTLHTDANYQFITSSIFAKWKPFNGGFFFKPGAEMWLHVNTMDNSFINEGGRFSPTVERSTKQIKPLQIFLGGGLGFEVSLKKMVCFVEFRPMYSLSNFFETSEQVNFNLTSVGLVIGCQF